LGNCFRCQQCAQNATKKVGDSEVLLQADVHDIKTTAPQILEIIQQYFS